MEKILEKIVSSVNYAGDTLMRSAVAKRVAASVLALAVVLTPIAPSLVIVADEVEPNETIEETQATTAAPVETEAAVTVKPTATPVPDYSEYATDEVVTADNDDIVVSEPTDTIDTTAPPAEETEGTSVETTEPAETTAETSVTEETTASSEETTVATEPSIETSITETDPSQTEETVPESSEPAETTESVEELKNNIVFAKNADEYYKLVASLPDGDRVVVDTTADLSDLEGANGVYYDGTYILVFDTKDAYNKGVQAIYDAGYDYLIDGTLSACGNFGNVINYGSLNFNASVKVAVIDTGSNLANEKYSVIGSDVADHNGHGTAMCDFILDETSNAYIISIKALGDNAQGNMSDVYAAVQLAEDLNVDYILLAMNIRNTGKYDAFESLIKSTKAKVVASAGNNGTDAIKYIPAGIPGVITVGAVGDNAEIKPFSNYGTCVEYYIYNADSTSEASARALGRLIDGRKEDIAVDALISENRWFYEGSEYYLEANNTVDGVSYNGTLHSDTKTITVLNAQDVNIDARSGMTVQESFNYYSRAYGSWAVGKSMPGGCIRLAIGAYIYAATKNCDYTEVGSHTFRASTGFRFDFTGTNSFMSSGGYSSASGIGLTGLSASNPVAAGNDFYKYVTTYAEPGDMIMFGYPGSSNAWRHVVVYDHAVSAGSAPDETAYYYGGVKRNSVVVWEATEGNPYGAKRVINAQDFTVTEGNKAATSAVILKANIPSTVQISLTKSSANPSATNGNSCYDLDGTTYELYSDAACTTVVATFTVGSDGKTTTVFNADRGSTYYLKETVAGKGYDIDNSVYAVSVSSDGIVTVNNGVSVTKTGDVSYMNMTDVPGDDPLTISLRKVDKQGNIVHNATLAGAVFQLSYYAQDLGASGNNDATPTVVYNVPVSGNSTTVTVDRLRSLTPVGGSNTTYISSLPAGSDWPYGTLRIQEITAPNGYKVNDQVVRYRLLSDGTVPYTLESNSSYGNGNRNFWAHQQDGSWDLTELPEVGYYALTKSLDDTNIRSSVAGFRYELYNTSSSSTPTQIATGVSQSDGRVLWTYTVPNYYKNTDDSVLLTGTTTYELELPATESNASGSEVAIKYEVRELISSIELSYGDTTIPYTFSTPSGWTKGNGYFYKAITVNSDDSVKNDTVVNNYEYTGLNVNKVVPTGNAFDMTKVSFKLYNTDGATDVLIAGGVVDSRGNVTWYKNAQSGYGTSPNSSINTINYLPLGHYRLEETWDKTYLDLNSSISILIEEQNNNGWTKSETRTTYTYTSDFDLSAASNDGSVLNVAVENEAKVQLFNLTKTVTTAGDASTIEFELYSIEGGQELKVATGSVTTDGTVGDFGVTWTYAGTHSTVNGLDTITLPVGEYRIVEKCPVTYYGNTTIPFTYMTPSGYTARTVNGELEFYKEFTLSAGGYDSVKSQVVENTRIETEFEIIKVERSNDNTSKTFNFEVYYRGNGDSAANVGNFDSSYLLKTVQITTTNGEGSTVISGLPEGWYEIREVGAGSEWIMHWANETSVVNGNKVVRASSNDRTIANPGVDDNIELNGVAISAVVCYNDVKPSIKTTLIDRGTEAHVTTYSETDELEDTISYKDLKPGTYTASGVLMDKVTGAAYLDKDGKEVTGSATFDVPVVLDKYGQPVPQSGTAVVVFTIDTTTIEGTVLVAFEELHAGASITGELIAEHKDIDDVDQTVEVPEIHTTATTDNGTHTFTYKERNDINDRVEYHGLVIGRTYVATGTLKNAVTGEIYTDPEGKTYSASTEFVAEASDGFAVVTFKDVLIPYEKTTIVVFEEVEDKEKGVTVAVHADLEDKEQTVERPTAHTTATINGNKAVWLGSTEVTTLTINDKIDYEGLEVGVTYRADATLYKQDGTQMMNDDNTPVTASVEFVPTTRDGSVIVPVSFSTKGLAEGDRVVVVEKIYDVATESEKTAGTQTDDLLIAKHEDLDDKDQTITVHFRPMTGGIDTPYAKIGLTLVLVSLGGVAVMQYARKRKDNEVEDKA